MGHEIEAKLKYDRHEDLAKVLKAAGAEFVNEFVQRDVYLDDDSGSIRAADAALRIREEVPSGGGTPRVSVTFKGPHEESQFKRRREANLDVTSRQVAEELFAGLGYRKVTMIEKKRTAWRLGGCEIALDELPLIGRFVEIEGPDEAAVNKVQAAVGLGKLSHIPLSYAALVEDEAQRRGIKLVDITLDVET